jgi:hypothetical protein
MATLRQLGRHGFSENEVKSLVDTFPGQLAIETLAPGPNGGRPSPKLKVIFPAIFDPFFAHA